MILLVALASVSALAQETEHTVSPRVLLKLTAAEIAASPSAAVRGIVTFVSGFETGRFVVAPPEQPKQSGIVVVGAKSVPRVGDLVVVSGSLFWYERHPALRADEVDVVRNEELVPLADVKQADYRRGLLEGRRVSLTGTILGVRPEETPQGAQSTLSLYIETYTTTVLVPGRVDGEKLLGEPVRVTGLARSILNENGKFLDATLEVGGLDDIVFLRDTSDHRVWIWATGALGTVLLVVLVLASAIWLRDRRKRREIEVIAAERRRMAADLHDTIEQHLAGANLMAAGVLALDGVTDEVREAMRTLTALLANAKSEVRSAVLNLRSTGDKEKSLADRIGEIAKGLEKAGVRTRKLLRGLPANLPEGAFQDIVLIVREATTNAVKHGKAKEIVLTADPVPDGGFVLRVLNDGVPFEVDRALGPETGHYGLSGMRERALRNRLAISWGRRERWTYVELRSEGMRHG